MRNEGIRPVRNTSAVVAERQYKAGAGAGAAGACINSLYYWRSRQTDMHLVMLSEPKRADALVFAVFEGEGGAYYLVYCCLILLAVDTAVKYLVKKQISFSNALYDRTSFCVETYSVKRCMLLYTACRNNYTR